MGRLIDLEGQRFGRLTVVARKGRNNSNKAQWLCRCDCGKTKSVVGSDLRNGRIASCGCLRKELLAARNTTHGLGDSRAYRAWGAMLTRCQNPNAENYRYYGGRGIGVCDRWKSFENFYADMGPPPKGKTLDRIESSGDYEPSNCRWATNTEQARNRRNNKLVTFQGKTMPLAAWAEETGIPHSVLRKRSHCGWGVERMLTQPVRKLPKRKKTP